MTITLTLIGQLMFNDFDSIHCHQNFTMLQKENVTKPTGKSLNICYLINLIKHLLLFL